jgi:hypothetical protein
MIPQLLSFVIEGRSPKSCRAAASSAKQKAVLRRLFALLAAHPFQTARAFRAHGLFA